MTKTLGEDFVELLAMVAFAVVNRNNSQGEN